MEVQFNPSENKNYSVQMYIISDADNEDSLAIELKEVGFMPTSIKEAGKLEDVLHINIFPNPTSISALIKIQMNSIHQ